VAVETVVYIAHTTGWRMPKSNPQQHGAKSKSESSIARSGHQGLENCRNPGKNMKTLLSPSAKFFGTESHTLSKNNPSICRCLFFFLRLPSSNAKSNKIFTFYFAVFDCKFSAVNWCMERNCHIIRMKCIKYRKNITQKD